MNEEEWNHRGMEGGGDEQMGAQKEAKQLKCGGLKNSGEMR
jgi:hypothetical protein